MKACSLCGVVKPLDAFYKGRTIDTLRPDCKACCSARAIELQRKKRPVTLSDWKQRLEAVGVKWCSRCDTVKPLTKFSPKGRRGDRSRWCHDCHSARMRERRKTDPELRAREYKKRKKWQDKHPEKLKLYRKRYQPKRMNRDSYIRHLIAHDGHIHVSQIPQEMVDLKRAQLKIKRLLRERDEHQRHDRGSDQSVPGPEGRQDRPGEGNADG